MKVSSPLRTSRIKKKVSAMFDNQKKYCYNKFLMFLLLGKFRDTKKKVEKN